VRVLLAVNHLGPGGSQWFATGLLPTTIERAIARLSALEHEVIAGKMKSLKGSADFSAAAPSWVWNQGNSECCPYHSLSFMLELRRALDGVPLGFHPSPLYFAQCQYATYRAEATPSGPLPPLSDEGAQLDDVARCAAQWGFVPMLAAQQDGFTDVPATSDDMGNPLPFPELAPGNAFHGAAKPFGGEYDCATGGQAGDLVAASLEAGIPVWCGGPVNLATMQLQAGQVEQVALPGSQNYGLHARGIYAYKSVPVNGTLQRRFLKRNSWGVSFCDGGNSWCTEEALEADISLLPFEVS
jgi:hypothetical protein